MQIYVIDCKCFLKYQKFFIEYKYFFIECESAKLRSMRAKNVLAYQRALRAYVLTCELAILNNVNSIHI